MLVEFMMALHTRLDAEMLHQHSAGACVLGKNNVYFLEHVHRSDGHIVKVAYRRRHHIEYAGFRCGFLCHRYRK